jgi:RNA-directed DNA polymerase
VSDGRLLGLIESFLKAGILEGLTEWTPVAGAPQGAVLSPLLSNIYLDPLDHLVGASGLEMVRYADDRAPRRREGSGTGPDPERHAA